MLYIICMTQILHLQIQNTNKTTKKKYIFHYNNKYKYNNTTILQQQQQIQQIQQYNYNNDNNDNNDNKYNNTTTTTTTTTTPPVLARLFLAIRESTVVALLEIKLSSSTCAFSACFPNGRHTAAHPQPFLGLRLGCSSAVPVVIHAKHLRMHSCHQYLQLI